MRCIVVIFCLLGLLKTSAQDFLTREHGILSPLVFNPAFAGQDKRSSAFLSSRRTWTGMNNSPSTSILNVNLRGAELSRSQSRDYISGAITRLGLGLGFYNDRNGPLQVNALQLAGSYRWRLARATVLSAGVSFKLQQYTLREDQFRPTDAGDPHLSVVRQSALIPNAHLGLLMRSRNFFAGISSSNVVGVMQSADDFVAIQRIRSYYFYTGYRFRTGEQTYWQPELLLRNNAGRVWLDVLVKIRPHRSVLLAAGCATTDFYSVYAGFIHRDLCFGYMYEYSPSRIYKLYSGNHMFFIAYQML